MFNMKLIFAFILIISTLHGCSSYKSPEVSLAKEKAVQIIEAPCQSYHLIDSQTLASVGSVAQRAPASVSMLSNGCPKNWHL
jgi:PBP1b-binding outer membrane lipoprotein LpoB